MSGRKLRVALVSPLPPPTGGIATWTKLMLRTPVDPDIDRVHANTGWGQNRRIGLPALLARQLKLTLRVCSRLIAARPDVVHVTTSFERGWVRDAVFLWLARCLGAATIVHLRGGNFEDVYQARAAGGKRRFHGALAACDAVIAINEATRRFLVEHGLTNVRVVPNCIDVRERASRPERTTIDRWLFVGHVLAAKGIAELFDALGAFPNAHLTIVGHSDIPGGDRGDALLAAAALDPRLRGRFTHMGMVTVEEAREAYVAHDLFVFPSRLEGFPNAVLEAMEAGLPIVATRVGAVPEMIVDGEHGLLVDIGDRTGLVDAIARMTSDPARARAMGEAARKRAASLYDVKRVASTWCTLYRELGTAALVKSRSGSPGAELS